MIIQKLSVACFAVTAIKPFVTQDTFKMVYHSYFHSIINYGIIFWGNSSYSIFRLHDMIVMGVGIMDSCTELFKIFIILPLISQYIFSLLLFVVHNKHPFWMHSDIHSISTRNNSDFCQPLSHLTIH